MLGSFKTLLWAWLPRFSNNFEGTTHIDLRYDISVPKI